MALLIYKGELTDGGEVLGNDKTVAQTIFDIISTGERSSVRAGEVDQQVYFHDENNTWVCLSVNGPTVTMELGEPGV